MYKHVTRVSVSSARSRRGCWAAAQTVSARCAQAGRNSTVPVPAAGTARDEPQRCTDPAPSRRMVLLLRVRVARNMQDVPARESYAKRTPTASKEDTERGHPLRPHPRTAQAAPARDRSGGRQPNQHCPDLRAGAGTVVRRAIRPAETTHTPRRDNE